jgi:hypothetical protein
MMPHRLTIIMLEMNQTADPDDATRLGLEVCFFLPLTTVIHVLMLHNHSVLHLGGILRFPAEGIELLRSNLFQSADLIPAEMTIKKFRMKNTL